MPRLGLLILPFVLAYDDTVNNKPPMLPTGENTLEVSPHKCRDRRKDDGKFHFWKPAL